VRIVGKIYILILAVFFSLVILVWVFRNIQLQAYDYYLMDKQKSDHQTIEKVLEFKSEGYLQGVIDNSSWDEMVDFTTSRDMDWASENLGVSRITFGVNLISAYDVQGKRMFVFSDSLGTPFNPDPDMITGWFTDSKTIHSFFTVDTILFEFFGAAIVPSFDIEFKTREHGYLIFAHRVDSSYLRQLEEATGFNVGLNFPATECSPDDEIIFQPLTTPAGDTLACLTFKSKHSLKKELSALKYIGFISMLLVIAGLIVIFWLINHWLTRPLRNITTSLEQGTIDPIQRLLDKKDEFGAISRLIRSFNLQKDKLKEEVRSRTEATEKYLALLKAQPDMIFILNSKGEFLDYYAPDESALYRKPSEFLGHNLKEIFSPEISDLVLTRFCETLAGQTVPPVVYSLVMQKTVHYYEMRPIRLDADRVLSVVRDITDWKTVQKELILARDKAQESDRLKSVFLSNMSHELRTPLNGILGFAELLEDESFSPSEKKEFISIINNSGRQLLTVINDIIDITRIENNQLTIVPMVFNLNAFIDSLQVKFEKERDRLKKSGIEITTVKGLPDDQCEIKTDEVRLGQILNNLIGNALKFTAEGYVRFGYELGKKHIEFFVRDSGKGIDPEKQKIIFERFRQEEESNVRSFGGYGLGLSIARGLVELLGGTLSVKSRPGEGSVFYFILPGTILSQHKNKEVHETSTTSGFNFRGLKILVADDVGENIELIRMVLLASGPRIIDAHNGLEAVEACRTHDDIDLVLMDVRMPEMDGLEATREIRKFRPDLPIIALTAHAFKEEADRCIAAGCNEWLAKPFSRQQLQSMISKFLNP